ncbi:MAG TPA: hypothetical protein VM433_14240 [Mycobacteriales bacterium]|nr:hypothetical protein [Mycobacteriales bacterium]
MSDTHLDLDRLADLLAGEGVDDDVAHVGRCAGCAGRLDELAAADAEVAAGLATLPPPAVPAGLADRISAALAAEPPLPASSGRPDWLPDLDPGAAADSEPVGGTASRTVTPFPARRRFSRSPFAAAAALVVAAGALGGGLLLAGGGGGADSVTAAGDSAERAAVADLPTSSTGRDYAAPDSLAAALPDLLGGGAVPAGVALDAAPEAAAPTSGDADSRALSSTADGADPLDRLREPEALASCLAAVLPPDDDEVRPIALDYAAYDGSPALVVVLPASGAPDKVDVFVVGAGCRQGADGTLFFTRLDRP